MRRDFIKMHGLGNDFVIFDQRDKAEPLSAGQAQEICDRRRGVGCDLIVLMQPAKAPQACLYMDMYNADGSKPENCANATRCLASFVMEESGEDTCILQSPGGLLHCFRADHGLVQVDMGPPVSVEDKALPFGEAVCVSVGNPHCIFFVNDADGIELEAVGPATENHPLFPDRTNVEVVQVISPAKLRMRVWERGCGITQACGTGACATMVAAAHKGLVGSKAEIILDGGTLVIELREEDGHILMTGPASHVFRGRLA